MVLHIATPQARVFVLRPLLRCWIENPGCGWSHVTRISRVVNFNLFNVGRVGKVFVTIFDLSHLKYIDKTIPHYPTHKQIKVYHAKSGWNVTSCNQGIRSSDYNVLAFSTLIWYDVILTTLQWRRSGRSTKPWLARLLHIDDSTFQYQPRLTVT